MVALAYDPQTKRDVALKVLPPKTLDKPESVQRFRREAEVVASLEHPAIVPVYDFGIEVERPFLVMRLMAGGSLADRISRGPIPLSEAVGILKQVASGLDFAHSKGVVHRDIKPTNILFDENGNAHIADFGIVGYMSGQTTLTAFTTTGGGALGTPHYMSPEQAKAKDALDGRSDIYSLGVVIFEMLTGTLPYQADTPVGIIVAHMTEPVPRIVTRNNKLPPGCDAVIQRAMAKDKNDRYPTASAAVADLGAALQGKPLAAAPRPTAAPPTKAQPTERATPPPPLKKKKRNPWPAIALLLILLGGLAAAGLWLRGQLGGDEGEIAALETPLPTQMAVSQMAEPPADNAPPEANNPLPTPAAQPAAGDAPQDAPSDPPVPTNTPEPSSTPRPSATPLPTFTPTPFSIPQFYDSFDNGISPEWEYSPDDWATVNGQLVNLRRSVGLNVGDQTWQNYSVEFDMIAVRHDSSSSHSCSLFILVDGNRRLTFRISYFQDGTWSSNGGEIPGTKVAINFPARVSVTANNGTITTFVNGEQVNQFTVTGYQNGAVGIRCDSRNNIFDNFLVQPLD